MDTISVTKFLQRVPQYKRMHREFEWYVQTVGNSYEYDESVCDFNLYMENGVFMELFIRKCLCKRFGMWCKDERAETFLERHNFRDYYLEQQLANAYAAYTDPEEKAMNIVEDIKLVAMTHSQNFYENAGLALTDYSVNYQNLKEVVKFINQLPYKYFQYKVPCGFDFGHCILSGLPDYVFDDRVFCQVATSKYPRVYRRKFAQVLFYILSHYEQNDYAEGMSKMYTVMIYNPLLGKNYTADILMTPDMYEDLQYRIEGDMQEVIQCYF
ncbi:uncharacterized protein [Musca autumnalis]|uniref:uncharacterized protein n=1 Tax=Musca autumnalis TaxID=221902 RepID=UPI003CF74A37